MLGVGYGHETLRRVASLAELAELAVLVAMSLVLVIRVIFRPTAASIMNTRSATAAREENGSKDRRTRSHPSGRSDAQKLQRGAGPVGLIIVWDVAREEQKTMDPQATLVSAARRRLSQVQSNRASSHHELSGSGNTRVSTFDFT